MLNPKISTSKKHQNKQSSPRSPLKLKDLNVSSSSSSFSSSTTISSEAPKGCLRFFHSNHSSIVSKNGTYTKLKSSIVVSKTPKSSPNVRNFKGNVVKKRNNLVNPDDFTARAVKKNVPAPHPGKSLGNFSSRCDLSRNVRKPSSNVSGFEVKSSDNAANLRKPSSRYDLSDGISNNDPNLRKQSSRYDLSDGISNNDPNLRKQSSRYDLSYKMSNFSVGFDVNLSDSTEDFTPVNKSGFGSGGFSVSRNNNTTVKLVENVSNCGDVSRSPTPPPVQSSVSPEIQGGLTSVVAATPATCYAAGHILSGVTDKRKCRPKGILTIGNNNLFGSGKTKSFHYEGGSAVVKVNNRRDSFVPSPTEASVCWLTSPCGEKKNVARDSDEGNSTNELKLDRCEKLLPFKLVGCSSSPLSSLGFSSEMFDKSNCTISTSYASSVTPSSSRSNCSMLNSDLSSEFRGVLGPSLDYLVRSPSPPSPVKPTFKAKYSPEQSKSRSEHKSQASPDLEDSFGSGNVMQTPESDSSLSNFMLSRQSPNYNSRSLSFDLSKLSNYQTSRLWCECELDSTTELLRRVSVSSNCQLSQQDSPRPSFEFNPLVKLDSSIDLTLSRNAMNTGGHDTSELLLHTLPDPEVRISWKEIDELDCCRYLSDEEDDAKGSIAASTSCSRP